jgi:hypothetical protein
MAKQRLIDVRLPKDIAAALARANKYDRSALLNAIGSLSGGTRSTQRESPPFVGQIAQAISDDQPLQSAPLQDMITEAMDDPGIRYNMKQLNATESGLLTFLSLAFGNVKFPFYFVADGDSACLRATGGTEISSMKLIEVVAWLLYGHLTHNPGDATRSDQETVALTTATVTITSTTVIECAYPLVGIELSGSTAVTGAGAMALQLDTFDENLTALSQAGTLIRVKRDSDFTLLVVPQTDRGNDPRPVNALMRGTVGITRGGVETALAAVCDIEAIVTAAPNGLGVTAVAIPSHSEYMALYLSHLARLNSMNVQNVLTELIN